MNEIKKKVKILVSKVVVDTLKKDAKHFNISKEKLCNDILVSLSLKKINKIEREVFDDKAYLQFTLTQSNTEYYRIITKNISDEAKYLKNIFTYYAHLNPFYRESLIYKDKLIVIKNYLEKREMINATIENRIDKVQILEILRCSLTNYIKLKTDKGEFYMNELRMIF